MMLPRRSTRIAGAVLALALTVGVSGCSEDPAPPPAKPGGKTSQPAKPTTKPPVASDRLGETLPGPDWVKVAAAADIDLRVCGKPIAPGGPGPRRTYTDPGNRTVKVAFVQLRDVEAASTTVQSTIAGCPLQTVGALTYSVSDSPSDTVAGGVRALYRVTNEATGLSADGASGFVVAVVDDALMVVAVRSNDAVADANTDLAAYADAIAAHQSQTYLGQTPSAVAAAPTYPDIEPLEPDSEGPGLVPDMSYGTDSDG